MPAQALKRSVLLVAMFAALVLVGKASPSTPPPPAADEATAYQMDATHDGSIADAGLTAPLTQAWSITLPDAVSYPLIADGMVFVTAKNRTVYGLDQATGSTVWSHPLGGAYAWSGLAYDDGQVFVVNTSGLLTAFDASTGSIAWSAQLPGQFLFSSAPTAANGIVYTSGAGEAGTVYATRETDGRLLWTAGVENGDDSSPAVTADGVYVSYACQQAYDFDPLSGSLLWHHSTGCEGGGGDTPVVASGHVYVRESPDVVLSASTGAEQGNFTAGPPPAVSNDVAYVLGGSTLSAIDGDGLGSSDWTFTGDGKLDTAPVVAGGLVFVGSSAGNLYGLDPTTGATTWSTNVGTAISGPGGGFFQPDTGLAAAQGTLVVPAGNELMAYRTDGAITDAPANQSPPSIEGPANLNEIEAADVGIWSGLPGAYSYQWELCDSGGANCADIDGATSPSYVPTPDDYGATVRVRVVATNDVGSSDPVESAASGVLGLTSAAPTISTAPVVSGSATVGQQLSTTNGTWMNSATGYAYQWQRCDAAGANCVDIDGATGPQYTLVGDDAGSSIRSEVLASNGIGPASGYAVSAATNAVIWVGAPAIPTAPADQATAFQLDPAHDGSIADAGLAAPLTQAWSVTLPATVWSPLIVDGMVFVTGDDGTVYALNQATGATIWSQPVGSAGSLQALTYDEGQVFVVDQGGTLTAFDAATGAVTWSEPLGQYLFRQGPTAMNGIVYVGGSGGGGTVYAVRESDGTILWSQSVEYGDHSSPAVTTKGVYVGYACHQDYDFDPLSGSLLWHNSGPCAGGGGDTPVVASGHVFIRDNVNGNVVLSAADGAAQGSFNPGPAPTIANDVAYMLDNNSTLSALAKAGLGNTEWTFAGDGNLDTAPPIVAGGLVFVASSAGNVYALDAATGATSWSTNVGTAISSWDWDEQELAAANGTLVVAAGSQLIAYRTDGAITDVPSNQSPPTIAGPADLSGIEAADVGIWSGLPSAYAYQWELCDSVGANCADIAGATGASFKPPAEDVGVGATLRVKVVATNGIGSSTPVESGASALPPLVSGAAALGQQLATTHGIWTNHPTSYAYRWQRCNSAGSSCTDIASANGSHYTLVSADVGHEIRSEVRASNGVGHASSYAPSAPTSPVSAHLSRPALSSAPVVSGKAALGSQLSTTHGVWTNAPTTYHYRWQRCSKTGSSCVNIANATAAKYTLVTADVGHEIRSEVLASNATGPAASGYAPSAPTAVVARKPVVITLPKLSGTAKVGNSLSVSTGSWRYSPTRYGYQWLRCTASDMSCQKISGATKSSYRLTKADAGHRLKAIVTASNAAGATTAASNTSAKVAS